MVDQKEDMLTRQLRTGATISQELDENIAQILEDMHATSFARFDGKEKCIYFDYVYWNDIKFQTIEDILLSNYVYKSTKNYIINYIKKDK